MAVDIFQELINAENECAYSFSQDKWENALIEGFRKNLSMGGVLVIASGLNRRLFQADWDALRERASKMRPPIRKDMALSISSRIWIANYASLANDALWDMDYARAKKLLKLGGIGIDFGKKTRRAVKQENRDYRGVVEIRLRSLDKRHDWKTVK